MLIIEVAEDDLKAQKTFCGPNLWSRSGRGDYGKVSSTGFMLIFLNKHKYLGSRLRSYACCIMEFYQGDYSSKELSSYNFNGISKIKNHVHFRFIDLELGRDTSGLLFCAKTMLAKSRIAEKSTL